MFARDRQHAALRRASPSERRGRLRASRCILARMTARICAFILLLTASPLASAYAARTAPPATGPLAEAKKLLNERGQQAAIDHATAAFARADLSRAERFELALFASTTFASMYRLFPDDPPGDPIYLCKALAMLDAAAELAAEPKELERHRKHHDARQRVLERDHPDYRCETPATAGSQDGLMPVPTLPRTKPPPAGSPRTSSPPTDTAVRSSPQTLRLRRRALALTAIGGTALGLGVASLAAMGGALALRRDLHDEIAGLGAATVSPQEAAAMQRLAGSFRTAERVALATGVVGTVMLLTGVTMVARGSVLTGRLRVTPDLSPARALLTVSGQF